MFLSHTSEFAVHPMPHSYIDAAKEACNRDGFLYGDMSLWTAGGAPAAELCRERVGACDVYVGIIGFSYGSPVRAEPHHSYTELEFEEARAREMHVRAFLLADDGDMPPGLARGSHPELGGRQETFRQRLLADDRITVALFRNPDQLKGLVARPCGSWAPPSDHPS